MTMLSTRRLTLTPLTPAQAQEVLAGPREPEWAIGYPDDGDLTAARIYIEQVTATGRDVQPWVGTEPAGGTSRRPRNNAQWGAVVRSWRQPMH